MVCPIRNNAAWRQGYFLVCLFTFVYTAPTENVNGTADLDAQTKARQVESALPPVSITVRPQVCVQYCAVRLQVVVPRDPRNRILAYWWEGGATGSSQYDLTGGSQVIWERVLEKLPAGEYEAGATIWRDEGKLVPHRTTTQWTVGGRED